MTTVIRRSRNWRSRLPDAPQLPRRRRGLSLHRRRSLRRRLQRYLPDWVSLPNWRWLPWYEPPTPKRERAVRFLNVLAYLGTGWLLLRPWLRRLGANQAELRRTYPGDELYGHAEVVTRAITIEARASDIWPWIVQMGYGRAGWYSIDLLDNLGRPSAHRILPGYQRIAVGDEIPSGPRSAFHVHDVEPERFLVLTYDGSMGGASWMFWLEPIDDNRTRLVERIRGHASANPLVQFTQLLGDAGDVVMMLAHLQNLKRRAERSAAERIASEVASGVTAEAPVWPPPEAPSDAPPAPEAPGTSTAGASTAGAPGGPSSDAAPSASA
jgi:hypothetical protein